MVRSGVGAIFATQKHVMLQVFLDYCLRADATLSSNYRSSGRKLPDFKQLDSGLLARLKTLAEAAAAKNARTTVQQLLRDAGSWSIFRHHREMLPKVAAFLREFRASENSVRQEGVRAYWRQRHPKRFAERHPVRSESR